MAKPNTTFELSVEDVDLIETALRTKKKSLSAKMVETKSIDEEVKDRLHGIQDLLGRLHNQKEFFRPTEGSYIGG